jgi:V8-like Glu-specific endopeptidase
VPKPKYGASPNHEKYGRSTNEGEVTGMSRASVRSGLVVVVSLAAVGSAADVGAAASRAPLAGGASAPQRAEASQGADFGIMPVVDPSTFEKGAPPSQGEPVPVGSYKPTVAPGSRAGRRHNSQLRVRCQRRAGRYVCQVRLGQRVVQRCRGRGRPSARVRSRCLSRAHRAVGAGLGTSTARTAALTWNGWPSTAMPSVGQLRMDGGGTCSATMVTQTLALTAGHCLYSNGRIAQTVSFTPGQTLSGEQPYGTWQAYAWWVPNEFIAGDFSMDFALVEIGPATNGAFLGNLVGMWDITPNIRWGAGAQTYLVGYPGSGFWATAGGFFGRGQYACDSRWDFVQMRETGGWSVVTDCTMNQGASGGPWFVKLNDGRWTIGGVNSRCTAYAGSPRGRCDPYARQMITSYPDSRFFTFWNAVQAQRHW